MFKSSVACLAAAFLALTLLPAPEAMGQGLEEEVAGIWQAELFAGQSPEERFPTTTINASAKRVEELGAALGISFRTADRPDAPDPTPVAAKRSEEIDELIKEQTRRLAEADRPGDLALPTSVTAFLAENRKNLEQLVETLEDAPLPVWSFDVDSPLREDLAIVGHFRLTRLLHGAARQALAEDRASDAERFLEAAWRLFESLEPRPELVTKLFYRYEARQLAATLKHHPRPATHWRDRFTELDLSGRETTRRLFDLWATARNYREVVTREAGAELDGALSRQVETHLTWGVQQATLRLATTPPRAIDQEAVYRHYGSLIGDKPQPGLGVELHAGFDEDKTARSIARIVYDLLVPNYPSWQQVYEDELVLEQTALLFDLRQRQARGEEPPATIPSRVVADLQWRVAESAGAWVLSQDEPFPQSSRYPFSWTFQLPTPAP